MAGSAILKSSKSWKDYSECACGYAVANYEACMHVDLIRRNWRAHAHQMVEEMLELAPLIVAGRSDLYVQIRMTLADSDQILLPAPPNLESAIDECIRWGLVPPEVCVYSLEQESKLRWKTAHEDYLALADLRLPPTFLSRGQALLWRVAYSSFSLDESCPEYARTINLRHRPA